MVCLQLLMTTEKQQLLCERWHNRKFGLALLVNGPIPNSPVPYYILWEKCDWREDLRLRCARLRDHTMSHQFRDPPSPRCKRLTSPTNLNPAPSSMIVLRASGMVALDDSWWDSIPSKLASIIIACIICMEYIHPQTCYILKILLTHFW